MVRSADNLISEIEVVSLLNVFFTKAILVVGEVKVGQGDLKSREGKIDGFRFGNFFASENSQFAILPRVTRT